MLYDISPPLSPSLAVFPGDTPLSREVLLDQKRGDHITLSTLRGTVHLGAHLDAPSHYVPEGRSIEEEDLNRFLGPCQVIEARPAEGAPVMPADLDEKPAASRVLLATGTYPDPGRFGRFAALAPELIRHLAASGVELVGVDTPSVDAPDSRDLPAHAECGRHGMRILEGLVLTGVPPGRYELIALPLRLVGFDASPVRAVLRTVH